MYGRIEFEFKFEAAVTCICAQVLGRRCGSGLMPWYRSWSQVSLSASHHNVYVLSLQVCIMTLPCAGPRGMYKRVKG